MVRPGLIGVPRVIVAVLAMCAGLLAAMPEAAAQGTPFRPVATVNKSVITAFDVEQRARLMALLGADARDPQQLGNVALERLIEDRLKVEAAREAGISATDETVEVGVADLAGQVGVSVEDFRTRVLGSGVTEQALGDMISAQMVWREVVQQRFLGRIELGEAEIDAEIAYAATGRDLSFRLQEIGLPASGDGRTREETRALADRLFRELSAGGDFAAAVAQYSRAPSAARGGEIGWVRAADLPPGLARILTSVPDGGLAPPQPVGAGISLIRVAERRTEGGQTLDPEDPVLRERVRQDLTTRRVDLLAQGLIQELRRDAMIEIR